jgi:hypothetical protein
VGPGRSTRMLGLWPFGGSSLCLVLLLSPTPVAAWLAPFQQGNSAVLSRLSGPSGLRYGPGVGGGWGEGRGQRARPLFAGEAEGEEVRANSHRENDLLGLCMPHRVIRRARSVMRDCEPPFRCGAESSEGRWPSVIKCSCRDPTVMAYSGHTCCPITHAISHQKNCQPMCVASQGSVSDDNSLRFWCADAKSGVAHANRALMVVDP